jgi:hypothetical protein
MRYVDFTVQTLLILLGLGLLIFTWRDSDWPSSLVVAQMFLGPWQVLSSIIGVAFRGAAHKRKRIHLLLSVLYFVILFSGLWIGSEYRYRWSDMMTSFYMFAVPWTLALYYYLITWRIVFPNNKKTSNFLPHINF